MNKARHILMVLICLFASNAHALNVQKFNPIAGQNYEGIGIFASNGLEQGQFETGLYLSYLENALEFGNTNGNPFIDSIVEHFLTTHFQAAYGLSNRVTLRATLPVNLYSKVEPIANFQSTEDMSLGDLSLNATITLIDRGRDQVGKWGLALIPFLTVPFNNEDDFFGDRNFTGGAYLALDRYLGERHYVSVNVGTRIREREQIVNLVVDDEFLYGLSYVYRLSCASKWDLVLELVGSTTYREFFSQEISSPYQGYVGVRKRSQDDHWEFSLGIGRGGNNGYGAVDVHAFTGLSYLFWGNNPPTAHCCSVVEEPEVVPTPVGRLEVFVVNQQDIAISRPIQVIQVDTDQIVFEKEASMMAEILPAGRYDLRIMDGDTAYKSMIMIQDHQVVKEKIVIEQVIEKQEEYVDPIFFDVNQDSIQLQSYAVLDSVIMLIEKYDGIEKIIINAHTDSDGKESYNLALSNRRAESVRNYLVEKGIDPSSIETYGFGERQPRVPNTTKENKALNRRVEFNLLGDNLDVRIINK